MGNEYQQMINLQFQQRRILGGPPTIKRPTLQNVYGSSNPSMVLRDLLFGEMRHILTGNDFNYGPLRIEAKFAYELFEFLRSDESEILHHDYPYPNSDFTVPMEFIRGGVPTINHGRNDATISVTYQAWHRKRK